MLTPNKRASQRCLQKEGTAAPSTRNRERIAWAYEEARTLATGNAPEARSSLHSELVSKMTNGPETAYFEERIKDENVKKDPRVVNLRRWFVTLSAAIEAAPDEETANALLDAECHALKDSLRELLLSRPDIKVTPGEIHDPREVPDSDTTYRWAVVYFYGPQHNRKKVVEGVIHGVPGTTRRHSIEEALKSSPDVALFSDHYGTFLPNHKIIAYTEIPTNEDDSSDRIDIHWDDLQN